MTINDLLSNGFDRSAVVIIASHFPKYGPPLAPAIYNYSSFSHIVPTGKDSPRRSGFELANYWADVYCFGWVKNKMDMRRHDDIRKHKETILIPRYLQFVENNHDIWFVDEKICPLMARKSDKTGGTQLVEMSKSGHG